MAAGVGAAFAVSAFAAAGFGGGVFAATGLAGPPFAGGCFWVCSLEAAAACFFIFLCFVDMRGPFLREQRGPSGPTLPT